MSKWKRQKSCTDNKSEVRTIIDLENRKKQEEFENMKKKMKLMLFGGIAVIIVTIAGLIACK